MYGKQIVESQIKSSDRIAQMYLDDLSDADLMVRPVPGANHIAWQLGHLICSEHDLIEMILPGSMPKLPEGFREKHNTQTASSDDPKAFCTKAEYLKLLAEQRAATLAELVKLQDADLSKPSPEKLRSYCPTLGEVFSMQGNHVTMHSGQWAVVRRKLGRKPLF